MLRDDHSPAPHDQASERSRLDPFVVATGDAAPRDQRDLMERPFFSLAKTPRTKPILYHAADVEVQVFGMPEHGMATIWDADVLIWAASQIVAAENNCLTTSRFFRFTPYHLLRAIGRPTGNRQYQLLKAALARLQSTVIATTIRNGPHLRERMRTLESTAPLPFRRQNSGDYLIPSLELRPGLDPAGVAGFSLHLKQAE